MTRKSQTVYLVSLSLALILLSRLMTSTWSPPVGDASIWFHTGLLMLILGMYWIEQFFTKPADAVVNALVVFVSTSTLTDPPLPGWWSILRAVSAFIVVVGLIVVWIGSPAIPENDTSKFKRVLYLLIIRIGSANVLFSSVFVLALVSFFDPASTMSRVLFCFWLLVLVLKQLDVEGLLAAIFDRIRHKSDAMVGRLTRFSEPNIVRFRLLPGKQCPKGALVAFSTKGNFDRTDPLAIVIAHRSSPTSVEVEAVVIDSQFKEGSSDNRHVVIVLDPALPETKSLLAERKLTLSPASIVGFATRDSDISTLQFQVARGARLEEGYLVSALSLSSTPIQFQIVNGTLFKEQTFEAGERSYTVGCGQQLGTWDDARQGFASHSWVVPENAPVVHLSAEDCRPAEVQAVDGLVDIGNVPSSSFPVKINLANLVLYHSAILGVTGSGKSFLAYQLIEKCAEAGIKVIALDLTGDYRRYVHGGVRLVSPAAIAPFLEDAAQRIGIVEFTDGGPHPISTTRTIAKQALDWCRQNRSEREIREPVPKVLLVLEEAHSLVPEWNSNPVPNLRETVNETSQTALQARKYGLGFMVVTQRTANVTKSILNQCNTILAFQAYDETGFEFMKNYMGLHYVHALPNLRKRHGVLVGKASTSDRPVIVKFQDQDRNPSRTEMPEFVLPVPAVPGV